MTSALPIHQPSDIALRPLTGGIAHAAAALPALLRSLPGARRVLEIGTAGGALIGDDQARPQAGEWIACTPEGVAGLLAAPAQRFDLIVLHADLQAVADPVVLLEALGRLADDDAALFVMADNHASYASLQRLIEGDLSGTVLAATSPASLFKQLMDAGWMPQLAGADPAPEPSAAVRAALLTLAGALGMPPATVQRTFGLHQLVIEARRCFDSAAASPGPARFAVVVPTTREQQLRLNVDASPGLHEVSAPVFACYGASSPADALNQALAAMPPELDWVLLCHQDVYFPAGFGAQLNALLDSIAPEARSRTLIGLAGTAVNAERNGYANAGFVIDRLHRFDEPASAQAMSIDEFAIVLARDSVHRIDPAIGWHLWATDLCLAAICDHQTFARIERLPAFHNSTNDYVLPADFYRAGQRLLAKYPSFGPIPTLCGQIDAAFCQRGLQQTAASPSPSPAAGPMPAPAPVPERKAAMHALAEHPALHAQPPAHAHADARPALCCVCRNEVRHWLPHPHIGQRSEFMQLMQTVGSDLAVYQCPSCGCTDRDRHLWLYMEAIGVTQQLEGAHVLHIAPERHLEALIAAAKPAHHIRGDLSPQRADHAKLDVEHLPFDDGCFDLVLCNHVLEHVGDPLAALTELHRCMVPNGVLIAQTPYSPRLKQTMELTDAGDDAFRTRYFGQADHVRLFGMDLFGLFNQAGFRGRPLPHAQLLPGIDPQRAGCNAREPFFVFHK